MPFNQLGLPAPIVKGVREAGYTKPTPIQEQAIPIILEAHDLVGAAQTGTGKTAAFLLPIIARLMKGHRALRALVLVPTRELAAQVEENAQAYARFTDVRPGVVFGGVPIGPQERMLRHQGVELLVATPGRLLDLHGRQSVTLDEVEVLVLDEADRMVDMGFAPDLRRILRLLPEQRQTLMFSATMPPELNRVAQEALKHPRRVDLAPRQRPVSRIAQAAYPVPRHLKTSLLDEVLLSEDTESVIVFTRTKHGADRLARQLLRLGHRTAALHGDRTQGQRERALADLKRGRVQVLVATDIASRGIDVDDISHVVNYDVPRSPEDYVHRIGRTGRVEADGDAFTLVSPEEEKDFAAIERFVGRRIERVIVRGFDYKRAASSLPREARPHGGRGAHGRVPGRNGAVSRGAAPVRVTRREFGPQVPERNGARPSNGVPARASVSSATARPSSEHGRRPQRNAAERRRKKM